MDFTIRTSSSYTTIVRTQASDNPSPVPHLGTMAFTFRTVTCHSTILDLPPPQATYNGLYHQDCTISYCHETNPDFRVTFPHDWHNGVYHQDCTILYWHCLDPHLRAPPLRTGTMDYTFRIPPSHSSIVQTLISEPSQDTHNGLYLCRPKFH